MDIQRFNYTYVTLKPSDLKEGFVNRIFIGRR